MIGKLHSKHSTLQQSLSCSVSRKECSARWSVPISNSEKELTRKERSTLAQLRSGYCSRLLGSYKSRIKKDANLDVCADCGTTHHDVKHLFVCPAHSTTLILSDAISRRETHIEMNMCCVHVVRDCVFVLL